MEDKYLILGKRIQELLDYNDINQTELADRLNTTTSSISAYILGKSIPRVDILFKLCDIFGVTFDYLFGFTNLKKPVVTGITEIPVLKYYKSGENNNIEENIDRLLPVASGRFDNTQNIFGLLIHTQAMRPRFYEGDIAIIERTKDVKTGDIVMVTIGKDNACIRELVTTTDGWVLNPFTPMTPPTFYSWEEIESKNIRLIGKVIESIVKF